jgi:hypothetical protein
MFIIILIIIMQMLGEEHREVEAVPAGHIGAGANHAFIHPRQLA